MSISLYEMLVLQGLNVYITVWDSDHEVQSVPYDLVDEFNFNFTGLPGAIPEITTFPGIRNPPKS